MCFSKKQIIAFTVFLTSFVFIKTSLNVMDYDILFLIATGREIVKNGFFYNNIFIIDSDCVAIVQQWLYCVFIAVADKFGYWGLIFFYVIQLSIFITLINIMLKKAEIPFLIRSFLIVLILSLSSYIDCLRPELISIIFCLAECIILENYVINKKNLLYLLPIITILESNFHGSLWMIHLAILAAYIIPIVNRDSYTLNKKNIKNLIFYGIVSTACSFITPYGKDNVMYFINSCRGDILKYTLIQELRKPELLGGTTAIIIFISLLIFFLYKQKRLSYYSFNIALGFCFLSLSHERNSMFLVIAICILLRDVFSQKKVYENILVLRKDDFIDTISTTLLFSVSVILIGIAIYTLILSSSEPLTGEMTKMCDYITSQSDNEPVYATVQCGSALEYCGRYNVYMDARNEWGIKQINTKKDLIKDISKYGITGATGSITNLKPTTKEELETWLDEYNFKYIVLQPGVEIFLHGYLLNSDDYRLVDIASTGQILVYQKIHKQ